MGGGRNRPCNTHRGGLKLASSRWDADGERLGAKGSHTGITVTHAPICCERLLRTLDGWLASAPLAFPDSSDRSCSLRGVGVASRVELHTEKRGCTGKGNQVAHQRRLVVLSGSVHLHRDMICDVELAGLTVVGSRLVYRILTSLRLAAQSPHPVGRWARLDERSQGQACT